MAATSASPCASAHSASWTTLSSSGLVSTAMTESGFNDAAGLQKDALDTTGRLGCEPARVAWHEHTRATDLPDELAAADGIDEQPGTVHGHGGDRCELRNGVRNAGQCQPAERAKHDATLAAGLRGIPCGGHP